MKMNWGIDETSTASSIGELDELIDRLDVRASSSGVPIMVEILHKNGRLLAVGLGREESVVSFFEREMRPSYTSTVDPERDGTITFEYAGEPSEFWLGMAIPIAAAREAIRQFARDGDRPTNILWDKDWT